jgi:hypothetical protein
MRYRQLLPLLLAVSLVLATGAIAASGASASARPSPPARQAASVHNSLRAKSSPAKRVKFGRFTHPKPPEFDHDQFSHPKLKAGPFHHRPIARGTSIGLAKGLKERPAATPAIDLLTTHVAPYDGWVPEEPTTAAVGLKVVYTSNDLLSLSVDGGHTFHSFDPRTMYADNPAGGPDGDQDVIYVPQINEFVWLVQYFPGANGANLDRLAVFPPSAVTASGLTSWTYWNITSGELTGTHPFLDFPDLAFGSSYLYLTQDSGSGGSVSQTFIARIGLTNLEHGLNLAAGPEAWRYITGGLFFGKVVQNTGSVAYWAANSSTSTMAASDWPESSASWFGPVNVNVYSWPNSNYSTTTPGGGSWLNLYTGTVLGSARVGNDLYFAWTAGRGSGPLAWLSNPHVELVEMTTSFKFVGQRAIWNPSYAFAWPYLTSAPNAGGAPQLGISLVWGGGKFYANAAAGDLTTSPFVVDATAISNANCGCGRWGDYLAVRPYYAAPGAKVASQFVATGYGYDTPAEAPFNGYNDVFVAFTG